MRVCVCDTVIGFSSIPPTICIEAVIYYLAIPLTEIRFRLNLIIIIELLNLPSLCLKFSSVLCHVLSPVLSSVLICTKLTFFFSFSLSFTTVSPPTVEKETMTPVKFEMAEGAPHRCLTNQFLPRGVDDKDMRVGGVMVPWVGA